MAEQIVDACCLINLCASGRVGEVIPACGGTFYVPDQVQRESLSIRQVDEHDPSRMVASPIDLGTLIAQGLLQECRLDGLTEVASYVEFATVLDDGEASCLAIARSRGWIVATDDQKAIRVATESGIAVITTPELVERWVQAREPGRDEIRETLHRIERFACFRPRRNSPWYDWWAAFTQSAS